MTPLHDIEILKWDDISSQFQILFPDVSEHFNRILKKNTPYFYRARYPFGTEIVIKGKLQVPFNGQMHDLDSSALPASIQSDLNYTSGSPPICALLKGFIESHLDLPSHLIPLRILTPGSLFSLTNLFESERVSHRIDYAYSSTSGARSLLILPKISHEQYNERIARSYQINPDYLCPKTFFDQWPLFKDLANAPEFKSSWHSEVIIFTKEWFNLIQKDPQLKVLFLTRLLHANAFPQNQVMYDLAWSIFADNLKSSVKNTPFVIETVKHLIKLAMSEVPGYAPSCSEAQAPIKELMDIFLNVYRIRYYLPTFMELSYYNKHEPIYYSLQKHTFLSHIPKKSNANRTIDELLTIKDLIESFKMHVLENRSPISLKNTILFKTLEEVEFDFYHPQGTKSLRSDIHSLINDDHRFEYPFETNKIDKNLVFPKHSLFFNGCIRIRPSATKPVRRASMKDFLTPSGAHFRLDEEK